MKQREIKYRAYNTIEKKWEYWEGTGLGQASPHWYDEKGTIIMQYTGLKDKKGKPIYEGDIVKGELWENREMKKWVGYVWYRCLDFVARQDLSEDKHQYTYKEFDSGFEVIGNIYQNPELLK